MKDALFVALLFLFVGMFLLAPVSEAGVNLVGEPKFHADHVEVEVVTTGRAGVRTTAADGALVWSQWLAKGQDVSLTVNPMGTGNPAELIWHGKTPAGSDRITFKVVWPGPCPCVVEVTAGDTVAFTWSGVLP